VASPLYDVSYVFSNVMDDQKRKQMEGILLREYYEGLVRDGVVGYSFEECFEELCMNYVLGFAWISSISVNIAALSPRFYAIARKVALAYALAVVQHEDTIFKCLEKEKLLK